MIDFCVLGSGVAGSTVANLLSKKYSVHVFDKARGPGGRSSNKRFKNNLSFDHGVQYISPKSKPRVGPEEDPLPLNISSIRLCWSHSLLDSDDPMDSYAVCIDLNRSSAATSFGFLSG